MSLNQVWVRTPEHQWIRGDQIVRLELKADRVLARPDHSEVTLRMVLQTHDGDSDGFGPEMLALSNKVSYQEGRKLLEELMTKLASAAETEGGGRISVVRSTEGDAWVRFKPFIEAMADPWQATEPTNGNC